jgi:hypothetical protein
VAWSLKGTAIVACNCDYGCRVVDGVDYDHSGQYTAVGAFDYAGR